jgi:RecB family exonuclease
MLIEYLSVSRVNTFNTCPQQYKFKYHDKVKSDIPEPEYFTFGNIVHKIAEKYVKNQGKDSLNEIANQILKGDIPLNEYNGKQTFAPALSAEYKKKLPKHLEAIQRLTKKVGFDGETEYKFQYALDNNHRLFTGVIDRLIKKESKLWIIDYKSTRSGKFRKDEKSIIHDIQLRSYARVVQREFNVDAGNIQVALYYLDPPSKLVAAKFSNKTLIETEKELLNTYKIIESTDPKKVWGKTGIHCNYCEFKNMCAFFKNVNKKQPIEKKLYTLGLV